MWGSLFVAIALPLLCYILPQISITLQFCVLPQIGHGTDTKLSAVNAACATGWIEIACHRNWIVWSERWVENDYYYWLGTVAHQFNEAKILPRMKSIEKMSPFQRRRKANNGFSQIRRLRVWWSHTCVATSQQFSVQQSIDSHEVVRMSDSNAFERVTVDSCHMCDNDGEEEEENKNKTRAIIFTAILNSEHLHTYTQTRTDDTWYSIETVHSFSADFFFKFCFAWPNWRELDFFYSPNRNKRASWSCSIYPIVCWNKFWSIYRTMKYPNNVS